MNKKFRNTRHTDSTRFEECATSRIRGEGVLSKYCGFGIKATVFIATQTLKGKRAKLSDVAREIDAPIDVTARLLSKLVNANILQGRQDKESGFEISIDTMRKTKMGCIVKAIDQPVFSSECALGLKKCNAKNPCPIHDQIISIRKELTDILENTTVYELANKSNN